MQSQVRELAHSVYLALSQLDVPDAMNAAHVLLSGGNNPDDGCVVFSATHEGFTLTLRQGPQGSTMRELQESTAARRIFVSYGTIELIVGNDSTQLTRGMQAEVPVGVPATARSLSGFRVIEIVNSESPDSPAETALKYLLATPSSRALWVDQRRGSWYGRSHSGSTCRSMGGTIR